MLYEGVRYRTLFGDDERFLPERVLVVFGCVFLCFSSRFLYCSSYSCILRAIFGGAARGAADFIDKRQPENHPNGASAARQHLGKPAMFYSISPMAPSRRRSISISGCLCYSIHHKQIPPTSFSGSPPNPLQKQPNPHKLAIIRPSPIHKKTINQP